MRSRLKSPAVARRPERRRRRGRKLDICPTIVPYRVKECRDWALYTGMIKLSRLVHIPRTSSTRCPEVPVISLLSVYQRRPRSLASEYSMLRRRCIMEIKRTGVCARATCCVRPERGCESSVTPLGPLRKGRRGKFRSSRYTLLAQTRSGGSSA